MNFTFNMKKIVKLKKEIKKEFFLGIAVLLIIISLLIVIVFFLSKTTNEINQNAECSIDSDCVKQETTCCSCEMGGEEACMTKENAKIYQQQLEEKCEENGFCMTVFNCKIKKCICQEGKCTAVGIEDKNAVG